MKVLQPDGSVELVPVISGNSFRGMLRRIGEELLRDVLGYEGRLPLAIARTLRNGGAIVKTQAEPVMGRRLHQLRELIPQLSGFGGAVGAAPIDGCLRVVCGKHIGGTEETPPRRPGLPPARGMRGSFGSLFSTGIEEIVNSGRAESGPCRRGCCEPLDSTTPTRRAEPSPPFDNVTKDVWVILFAEFPVELEMLSHLPFGFL
ncbi:hypothetical protein [Rhodococcus opacus]|uniref:hypothetical protein n=1 Tax=Rhodococcus opacus TaxID=37919 RepID=UPI0022355192|nr:hypothetical protein [Rhodococcus opacus]UZG55082.1 hypothetical protein ONE62_34410 [Rhodococcus opacus]